jgi:hypothetical protein
MELWLLSATDARPEGICLVDPSPDKITDAILRLPGLSGERRPRALLLHDNGRSFVQFFLRPGTRKGCHIQYFEMKPGDPDPEQYFNEGKSLLRVAELFKRFAEGAENWNEGFYWKPLKPRRFDEIRIIARVLGGMALIGASLLFFGESGIVGVGAMLLVGGLVVALSIGSLVRTAIKIGVPWTAKTSVGGIPFLPRAFGGGNSGDCSSGSCGSGGGGDGGGGGCGGGCGGGGE